MSNSRPTLGHLFDVSIAMVIIRVAVYIPVLANLQRAKNTCLILRGEKE
jgi:hypothetical protein